MKKLWKRIFAYLLVCFSLFMICAPGAYASQPVETSISVALGAEFADGAEGDISTMDDLLALAVSGYFGANGVALVNYNQSRESYVDMIVRYFKEYYTAQVDGSAARDFYDWIANSITETALGIRRIRGAVDGALDILIGEPLAKALEPFKNWWNNKFNPQDTVETAQTVEIVRDTSVAAVTVPLADGSPFALSVQADGSLFGYLPNSDSQYGAPSALYGTVLFNSVGRKDFLNGYFLLDIIQISGYSRYRLRYYLNNGDVVTTINCGNTDYPISTYPIYLAAGEAAVYALYRANIWLYKSSVNPLLYSYFYSGSEQFDNSGVSVTTMSVSSDGSLSYGPDTSEADNIVQNTETLSVPIIAPSVSGNSLSFSASDTLAELVEKALQSVTSSLTDASSNTLELPSNDSTLSPDISIEANIDWADDTASEVTPTPTTTVTPTPTITPGAIVTVAPTSGVTPWPVSEQQIAVLGSDGQIAIVDVVQTIKGWTQSLTEVYQGYVNLISAVFPFLPDELIVLLNWSLAALIFTGLFKRWWWSHH